MLNFDNVNTEIPLPNSCCSGMKCAWRAHSEKKNKIVTIVAMSLPKMGGKKKWLPKSREKLKKKCYVHNIFTTNHRCLVIISSNLNLTLRLLF